MKANQQPEQDATLDRILREWVVEESLPPRFQERVWNRIAQAEAKPQPSFRVLAMRVLEVILPQPKVAYSYVLVLLVMGVGIGAWEAQKQNSRLETSLGSRYLQSVNPFQTAAGDR